MEDIDDDSIFKNSSKDDIFKHPFEMIYWSLGKYFKRDRKDLAKLYLEKAIQICEKMGESTIKVIELAIEAEKLCLSNNINQEKQTLLEKYHKILNVPEYYEIHKFLEGMKDEFECIEIFDNVEDIKEACKIIAGSVRV